MNRVHIRFAHRNSGPRRMGFMTALLLAGLMNPPSEAKKGPPEAERVEDLQIVDCLLPGQVRRLGRVSNYVTPRRPVRTTAIDCRIRGGDYIEYDRADYSTALAVWLPEARAGNAEAQTHVGEIFEKGLAATPDFGAAAEWYRRAAEQGFYRAQVNLGQLYESGRGVEKSPQEALRWYRRAAGLDVEVQLDATEELRKVRAELDDLTSRLTSSEGQLTRARIDLEKARGETQKLSGELERAQKESQSEARIAELSSRLAEEEKRVEVGVTSLSDLEQTVQGYARRLAELEEHGPADEGIHHGPRIEIVEPNVLVTRGPVMASIAAGLTSIALLGHVTAPGGIERLTVDGEVVSVNAEGFFQVGIAIKGRTEVQLEARDRLQKVGSTQLVLVPLAAGSSPLPALETHPSESSRTSPKGKRLALVIHAADYLYLEPLNTAENDARSVARILEGQYGFEVTSLANPSYFDLLRAFNEMSTQLGEQDSLLVYYAGHGSMSEEDGKGFWLPVDAQKDDKSNWIPNETISDYLSTFEAQHVMVVSDSCYAGTMTDSALAAAEAGGQDPDSKVREKSRSRTVLTSGGLQPVLDEGGGDHSVFARFFLNVLELNREDLEGAALHREVAARVSYTTGKTGLRQFPEYAPIRFAGHEGGDFVFVRQ